MSNVKQVQGAPYTSPAVEAQTVASSSNQGTWFGSALGQVERGATTAATLTPSFAQYLMYRSMTTGVPNAEMEQYGGYTAVKSMFDAGGGRYSLDAIPAAQRQQLAQQVASTGVGNMSLLVSEHMSLLPSALYEMANNGVDQASINQIFQRVQEGQGSAGAAGGQQAGSVVGLTPSIAQGLMQRSMTTGVPKSEMDLYGGYDAVKAMYDSNSGSYSVKEIAASDRKQLAMQVAATGVGNVSVAVSEQVPISMAVLQTMSDNGIDIGTIDGIKLAAASTPFIDSSSYIDSFMGSQSTAA